MSLDITIHSTGMGQCSLTGKEAEGLSVSFKDGTLRDGFLSFKAFSALVRMKLNQDGKGPAAAIPTAKLVDVK